MLKKIGLGLVAIVVIIQFFTIDKVNPEVIIENDFITKTNPPENIKTILKNACYDCHSFETKYPWYSNVAPISWWLADHIDHGRGHLNFSEWATYPMKKKKHKIEECWEMVEENEMPLESYLYTHSEAELTTEEKAELVKWFKSLYADPTEPEVTEKKEVQLNNGELWEANIETTQGIASMGDIAFADFDTTNLSSYQKIGADLNVELRNIFSSCSMKGEAHVQLHNYILPLVSLCEKVEKAETLTEAKTLHYEIKETLNSYANYFKTDLNK